MADRPFTHTYFEQYLKEKRLMASRCQKCGKLYLPPRPMCSDCYGEEMEWVQMKGNGKLAAFTCIAVGPTFMCDQGFDRDHPYCSGIVALEEGAKVSARILGVDAAKPETIEIGTPMTMEIVELEDRAILGFKPASP